MTANEFNKEHITEGLDRCHIITTMMNEFLRDHPAVLKANGTSKVDQAIELISDLYQDIGNLDKH